MEYIWHTLLKRQDSFWNITPKNFFNQWEAHIAFHTKGKDNNKKIEVVNSTSYM